MQQNDNPKKAQDSKLHFLDYWRIIRIRKTVILAVFLLVVLTTTVVTFLLKPTYSSTVRIAIEKDSSDIAPLLGMQANMQYDPYFIQTEFEKIQSKKVLHEVIRDLGLNKIWAERYNAETLTTNETYMVLQKLISINQFRNTSIIEITAFSEDREEAAKIANSIAEQYQNVRLDNQGSMSRRGIEALKEQFEIQNDLVIAKQVDVDELRSTLGIADIYSPEGSSVGQTIEPQTVLKLENERTTSQASYVRYKALFESLKMLSRDELRKAALTAVPNDQHLARLLNEYDVTDQKIASNKAIYGPNHTEMQRLLDLKEALDGQIEDKLDGILIGLQTQLVAAKKPGRKSRH